MFFHQLEKAVKFIHLVCYSQLQNTDTPCSFVDRIYCCQRLAQLGRTGSEKLPWAGPGWELLWWTPATPTPTGASLCLQA